MKPSSFGQADSPYKFTKKGLSFKSFLSNAATSEFYSFGSLLPLFLL